MLQNYVPVLLMLIFGVSISVIAVALSSIFGPRRRFKVKRETYECGIKTDGAQYSTNTDQVLCGRALIS